MQCYLCPCENWKDTLSNINTACQKIVWIKFFKIFSFTPTFYGDTVCEWFEKSFKYRAIQCNCDVIDSMYLIAMKLLTFQNLRYMCECTACLTVHYNRWTTLSDVSIIYKSRVSDIYCFYHKVYIVSAFSLIKQKKTKILRIVTVLPI